jgi:hypothetical protein
MKKQIEYSHMMDMALFVFSLRENATAYDDDLEETWEDLKARFEGLETSFKMYVEQNEQSVKPAVKASNSKDLFTPKKEYLGFITMTLGQHEKVCNTVLKLKLDDGRSNARAIVYRFDITNDHTGADVISMYQKNPDGRLYRFVRSFLTIEDATAFLYTSECP